MKKILYIVLLIVSSAYSQGFDSLLIASQAQFANEAPADPYGTELLDVSLMTAQNGTMTYSAGTWSFLSTGRYAYLRLLNVLTVGVTYKVEITIANYVSGNIRFNYPFTTGNSSANGTYTFEAVCTVDDIQISPNSDSANTFDITAISVKRLL